MRVVKEAEERRTEILDVAEELFATKGFDNTSTNDILNVVGIARGTLYYHFRSKEDILNGVIDRMVNSSLVECAKIVGNTDTPILERMTKGVLSMNIQSKMGEEVMAQVHKPQNALLHQKLQEKLLKGIIPIFTKLVEEGNKTGIFDTEYPMEAMEMIMLYSNTIFDDLFVQTPEQQVRRIQAFITNTERILGAKPGVLQANILQIFEGNQGLK